MRPSKATVLLSTAALVGGLSVSRGAEAQQAGAEAFVGTWEGVLDTGQSRLRLVLHVHRADDGGMSGTLDSPDQGANGIPASEVSASDGELRFAVANLGVTYTARLSPDGAGMSGTFMQGGAQLPLDLTRQSDDPGAAATPPNRPQNPKPPLPYDTEEVAVQSAPGVTLAGTLTLPRGAGPFPAAVLVSGSGPAGPRRDGVRAQALPRPVGPPDARGDRRAPLRRPRHRRVHGQLRVRYLRGLHLGRARRCRVPEGPSGHRRGRGRRPLGGWADRADGGGALGRRRLRGDARRPGPDRRGDRHPPGGAHRTGRGSLRVGDPHQRGGAEKALRDRAHRDGHRGGGREAPCGAGGDDRGAAARPNGRKRALPRPSRRRCAR